MNNAPFGTLANLYHRPRQPMQGGQVQQPMQQPMQGGQNALGGMINAFQQQIGAGPQRQGGMNAIIAQLMKRRGS